MSSPDTSIATRRRSCRQRRMSSITILMRPTVELLVIRREEKQSTETKRGRTMKLTMEIPRVPIAIFPAGGLYHANSMRLLDCARDMTSRCSQLECLSAHGFCRRRDRWLHPGTHLMNHLTKEASGDVATALQLGGVLCFRCPKSVVESRQKGVLLVLANDVLSEAGMVNPSLFERSDVQSNMSTGKDSSLRHSTFLLGVNVAIEYCTSHSNGERCTSVLFVEIFGNSFFVMGTLSSEGPKIRAPAAL